VLSGMSQDPRLYSARHLDATTYFMGDVQKRATSVCCAPQQCESCTQCLYCIVIIIFCSCCCCYYLYEKRSREIWKASGFCCATLERIRGRIRDTVHETTALTYAYACRGDVESMVHSIRQALWDSLRKRIMPFVRLRLVLTRWYTEVALRPPKVVILFSCWPRLIFRCTYRREHRV
jgi:hypothetical protein